MARAYFKSYHSDLEAIEPLNDAERGRLWTALLYYSKTGESPELRGNERFVFFGLKARLDRDAEAYESTCRTNSESARMRWDANACAGMRTDAKNKKKNKNKSITPISPAGDEEFASFWQAYPRKEGKEAARKVFAKINPDAVLLSQMLSAIEVQKRSQQWQKNGGQYIPHPSTWLSGKRWQDQMQPASSRHGYEEHSFSDGELDGIFMDLDSDQTPALERQEST